jgi:predicted DNA-binding protein (MmcQ/YjbR family)
MDIEEFRAFCLAKQATSEGFPFGPETLVLKVGSKMFALTGLDSDRFTVNLKCTPEQALEWREMYPEVQPGWHMNKTHWNTVDFEGSLSRGLLCEMIDSSYHLVAQSLKKAEKAALGL